MNGISFRHYVLELLFIAGIIFLAGYLAFDMGTANAQCFDQQQNPIPCPNDGGNDNDLDQPGPEGKGEF